MESPPEEFKKDFELLRAIFTNIPSTHAVSDPVPVDKGYVIFKVTNIAKPAQQELKDVKDKVRDTLVDQKATESMQKAANEAKSKLEAALKAGKKFDVAAKEAGFTPQILGEFSPSEPLTTLSNGRDIAREAMVTPAGSFTKPLATENGIILIHVLAKELRKSPDSATQKQSLAANVDERTQADLFKGWFEQRYEKAAVKFDPALLTSSLSLH
jgi:parvulin-like peptidyl-prolyl isomerase